MDLSRKSLKTTAKAGLKGHWAVAIFVVIVANLFGAYGGAGYNESGTADDVSERFHNLNIHIFDNDVMMTLMSFVLPILAIMAVWMVLSFIIGPVIALGERTFFMSLCRGEPVKFSQLFSKMSIFIKAWCLNFMIALFIILWSLLFVIPGIIAMYRYFMAKYIMAEDENVGVMEAIRKSKEMMKGYKGKLFVLQLSFIGWALLCILTLGIGYFWLVPYIRSTETAFYLELSKISGANIPADAPAPAPAEALEPQDEAPESV